MAVFKYSAIVNKHEDTQESGTIVAETEGDARAKLEQLKFRDIRLKKLTGLAGLLKSFTADIR